MSIDVPLVGTSDAMVLRALESATLFRCGMFIILLFGFPRLSASRGVWPDTGDGFCFFYLSSIVIVAAFCYGYVGVFEGFCSIDGFMWASFLFLNAIECLCLMRNILGIGMDFRRTYLLKMKGMVGVF